MSQVAVILPTMPPKARLVRIPDSMTPSEKGRLIDELAKISTELARLQVRDEERSKFSEQRFKAIDARIKKLDTCADDSASYDLAVVTKALDVKREELAKWKWWGLSILAAVISGGIMYYIGSIG